MPRSGDELLPVLQCLCDAALDDVAWGRFLEALCKSTGSVEADLFVVDPLTTRCTSCISFDLEKNWVGRCDLQASDNCVWVQFGPGLQPLEGSADTPQVREISACPTGVSVVLGATPPSPGLSVTELWRHDGRHAYLALRRRDDGPLLGEEAECLSAILPFLRRAFLVAYRLESGERRNAMLVRAVEHNTTGITLLEAHGQIVYTNQAAREILSQGDGLFADAGRLRAERKSEDEALQRLIRGAIGPPRDHEPPIGGIIAVPRRSGNAPYAVVAVPVRLERTALRNDEAVATVFLSDPTALREISDTHIRHLYRLTPKEAKLAVLLASGATVATAATALGMAEKTARIHLQGLFRKTGTRRQVDLVRILLGSAGPTRAPKSEVT